MTELHVVIENSIGHTNLVKLASKLLKSGVPQNTLFTTFNDFLLNNDFSDDIEDQLVDVLSILDGYHNPYVVVNKEGISVNKPSFFV